MSEPEDGSDPVAVPQAVSLSYHDAGRWLDAQETVETSAAPSRWSNGCGRLPSSIMCPNPSGVRGRKAFSA